MTQQLPYVSIIITGRNDDYQKDGFKRMKMAISMIIAQAKKHSLAMELIIVDWNPPAGKPWLKDVIELPFDIAPATIRFVVVPPSVHARFKGAQRINIINVAAFNVGIRRARGEFIMATNSDILFSDELIQYISRRALEKDRFYRAFRFDVDRKVLNCRGPEQILDFCRNNVVQAFLENAILSHPRGFAHHPVLQTDCGGDFILFHRDHWAKIHGYPLTNNLGLASDVLLCYMAYLAGLKETVLDKSCMRVYHIDHDSRWRGAAEGAVSRFLRKNIYNKLSNTSKWKALIRRVSRMRRFVSDAVIDVFYRNFGTFLKKHSPDGSWDFNIGYLLFEHKKVLFEMLNGQRSYVYNAKDWGMPQEHFEEFVVAPPALR